MNIAIILSGGIGSRMKSEGIPKQYIEIRNKPILMYTVDRFQKCNAIDKILIVADKCWHDTIKVWLKNDGIEKFMGFALPGNSRQGSILNGLKSCIEMSSAEDKVINHDEMRALVNKELITHCVEEVNGYDGCMPVLPVTDTIYYSSNGTQIDNLLDRDKLFSGQSPEAFNLKKYYDINISSTEKEINETKGSSEIAFKNNLKIKLIQGEENNFKLTTPSDLRRFKIIVGDLDESI